MDAAAAAPSSPIEHERPHSCLRAGLRAAAAAAKVATSWAAGSTRLATAVAALIAVQLAARPADSKMPFGYYKAEYFSAVLEGVFIVVAALLIFYQAWQGFSAPSPLDAPFEARVAAAAQQGNVLRYAASVDPATNSLVVGLKEVPSSAASPRSYGASARSGC